MRMDFPVMLVCPLINLLCSCFGTILQALAKTLTADEVFYLKEQFTIFQPNKNGSITLENIRMLNTLQHRNMEFEEFCAAALSVHQLEALDRWEQHARSAYEIFDQDGNRAIVIQELASELGLGPSIPVHAVLNDWIRHGDGKLSFHGFIKLLHGMSSRAMMKAS
ncbi:unnamed protein product [Linum tenue]|uniref:Uncharacterized protein n=1 Tax=Linum tenue TaxID=586396 RepID=A0AAV0RIV8_9ROSI|nr:unnamed protein product [Linum tenue]